MKKAGLRPLKLPTAKAVPKAFANQVSSDAAVSKIPLQSRTVSMSAADQVNSYLESLPDPGRRLTPTEWGLTCDCAGWPIDIGIALRDGLLRIQAPLLPAGQIDERTLLWWNRRVPLIRFSTTQAGEVWICCDLPTNAVTARELDRTLGLIVLAGSQARQLANLGSAEHQG